MATYKKALKTVEVKTSCDTTYTAADTAEKAIGSSVLSAFMNGKTLAIETGENEMTYVPFHAVCAIKVTTSTADVEKSDPYNCEDNSEPTPDPEP